MFNESKLTEAQVLEIRHRYFYNAIPYKTLARDYNVSPALLNRIVHGKKGYQHIQDDIPQDLKDRRSRRRVHGNSKRELDRNFEQLRKRYDERRHAYIAQIPPSFDKYEQLAKKGRKEQ